MDGPLPEDLCKWWEEFLQKEKFLATAAHRMNALFASRLHPLQRRREMEKMFHRVDWVDDSDAHAAMAEAEGDSRVKTVMSIGTDKGGDIYAWLRCFPGIKNFVACEIRGLPYAPLFERAFPQVDFLWLASSSHHPATVKGVRAWLGMRRIDALFIDGDKGWMAMDFEAYLPLMARPGTALFHDVTDEVPGREWAKTLARHPDLQCEEIVDRSEWEDMKDRAAATEHDNWLKVWAGRSCGVGVIHLK